MNAIALICARGGSKGVPGKNIRPLGGKPLIAWAIQHAHAVARIDRVIVSTDAEDIAAVARLAGAEVPFMRPADLARDDSPEWLVWRHALDFVGRERSQLPDALVVVPTTSPLRHPADIDRCLDEYDASGADVVITVTEARRSPYYNMITTSADGDARLVIPPRDRITGRQQAPPVYDMTTVAYVARPSFVLNASGLFDGRVRAVVVPAERALDIDTPLDFRVAECLLGEVRQ